MSTAPPPAPPSAPEPPAPHPPGTLEPRLAAALAYLWIPAIIFLLAEPWSRERFVRFHSFQALAIGIFWMALSVVLGFVPLLGWMLLFILPLASLAIFVLCVIKAYGREWFKLPVIGDWAEQQANAGRG